MTLSFLSTRQFLRRSCREYFLFCLTVLVITSNTLVVVEAAYDDPDYDEKKREKPSVSELYQKMKTSKLWFLRDIHPSVPFSPLTALIVGLVTLQLYVNYGTYAYCEGALELLLMFLGWFIFCWRFLESIVKTHLTLCCFLSASLYNNFPGTNNNPQYDTSFAHFIEGPPAR